MHTHITGYREHSTGSTSSITTFDESAPGERKEQWERYEHAREKRRGISQTQTHPELDVSPATEKKIA